MIETSRWLLLAAVIAGFSALQSHAAAAVAPTSDTSVCGNGEPEANEECDDGGTCIGGTNAGTHCTAESQCQGDGVCSGGTTIARACHDNADCPGTTCVHCVPQGGDGCAANCTFETQVNFKLIDGVLSGDAVEPGTSGGVAHGDTLTIPLALGGTQRLVIGKQRNGVIPAVVKVSTLPPIDVGGLACGCIRSVAAKTCGGTAFNRDGSVATDCTDGYTAGGGLCPSDKPCTFVHGDGNAGTGVVGCNGLAGVDIAITQDNLTGTPGAPSVRFSASGPPGSAVLLVSTAIGTVLGSCTAQSCTDAEPFASRGMIQSLPLTTGTASGEFTNANGIPDDTVCQCSTGDASCPPPSCVGPWTTTGAPLDCANLSLGNGSGAALAGSFPVAGLTIVGDAVVTNVLVGFPGPLNTPVPTGMATPTPTVGPPCDGDCSGDGQVTTDELLTLVHLDLLGAPAGGCLAAAASEVTVAHILRAVNNAVGQCSNGNL